MLGITGVSGKLGGKVASRLEKAGVKQRLYTTPAAWISSRGNAGSLPDTMRNHWRNIYKNIPKVMSI
jgi:hypothetical protein